MYILLLGMLWVWGVVFVWNGYFVVREVGFEVRREIRFRIIVMRVIIV